MPGIGEGRRVLIYGPQGQVINRLGKGQTRGLVLPSGLPANPAKRRLLDAHGNPVYDVQHYLAERKKIIVPQLFVVARDQSAFSAMEQHYLVELLRTRTDLEPEHLRAVMQLVDAGTVHFDAGRAMKEQMRSDRFDAEAAARMKLGALKPLELAKTVRTRPRGMEEQKERREMAEALGGLLNKSSAKAPQVNSPYLAALREELIRRSMRTKLWLPRLGMVDLLDVMRPD